MTAAPHLLTLSQAAQQCGLLSPKLLRRAVEAGELTVVRLGTSARSDRIHPADLAVWWGKRRLCQSRNDPKAATKLQLDTADERCADLLGIGRTPTRARSKPTSLPKSAPLRLVRSRTES